MSFIFFNDTATTEIYTLSLHDALPICYNRIPQTAWLKRQIDFSQFWRLRSPRSGCQQGQVLVRTRFLVCRWLSSRSEEHTSELQSRQYLVCRLLLEKKNTRNRSEDHTS